MESDQSKCNAKELVMSDTISDFIWEESNRFPWQQVGESECCGSTVAEKRPEDSHAICTECGEWARVVYEDDLE